MTRAALSLASTLAVGSIEAFLTPDETRFLPTTMDEHLDGRRRTGFGAERRTSIHEIPGHTAGEAMSVYEPAGRVEVPKIPAEVDAVLQAAVGRSMPTIGRLLPAATGCRPWMYVEYGPGQYITSHVDGIAPDPGRWPRQVAGISVVVEAPVEGGEFYIETTSDDRLWHPTGRAREGYDRSMEFARDGADRSSPWFTHMPRTRWTTAAPPGTALLYGSQLAHGTRPVWRGRSCKFISWLIAERT